jgi:phosphopantetheinyl transferase
VGSVTRHTLAVHSMPAREEPERWASGLGFAWSFSRLATDATRRPVERTASAVLGPDVERWRSLHSSNRVAASRLLASRTAVCELVSSHGLFPWRGFAPSVPGRKPAFAGDSGADFSISHSAGLLVVAVVVGGRVGADVEVHEDIFDRPGLVRRMCTAAELEYGASLEGSIRQKWLARLWTAKEAIAKLSGRGMRADFRSFEIGNVMAPPPPGHSVAASIAITSGGAGTRLWHPQLRRIDQDLVA